MGGEGEDVEAEEGQVAEGFPRVPPLPAVRVVAASEGGGGHGVVAGSMNE
jgi:hypothetical protein